MSGEISESKTTSSKDAFTATTAPSHSVHPRRRIAQNVLLIWFDTSIDKSKQDCQNALAQLRSVVKDVNIFTQPDECIDFLTEVHNIKAFLILGGILGQQIVPLIHDIPQLDSVYIFNGNKPEYEQWAQDWTKVKGVHTNMTPICESLQQDVKQCNQDSIAVSFVALDEGASNKNLDQLEPSFMYTQIFKETLLAMKYDRQSVKDFTTYCRNGDYGAPSNIDRFENEYPDKSAIWWYTFLPFTYSMLNYALRTLEAETIIKMGFFIYDLHNQIQQLHQEQVGNYYGQSFIVYRGQGLSTTNFDKLLKAKGGLISFNNFLSTSKDEEVSLGFAKGASTETDMVGILFKMSIDPSVSSTPFASIQEISSFQTEEEILFSMHTVFRIGEINRVDNNSLLYQVELKLTTDDDHQLRTLTDRIREEIICETGWRRLGILLDKIGQLDKAEELYLILLEQTSDEGEKAAYYNNFGCIKNDQGDYEKAIEFYEKALVIDRKTLPSNHPSLATIYNNIGSVYQNMGEYSKALLFYETAVEINQKTLPSNHPSLATCHNNIGLVYQNMGEYSKALSRHEKALEIRQKILPSNHPDLTTSYNSIGMVYNYMGEYSKALSFHEKVLDIFEKSLPSNHPWFSISYNNIGSMYRNMGEYSRSVLFYEKALEIDRKTLPPAHPSLATSYNNIGEVYERIGKYSKALPFYEKALEICQKTLPPTHASLATSYNNIGLVYQNIGEYSKALSFYEKAVEIEQKTLPSSLPLLATSYNNIGLVYTYMGEHSKALSFYEKSLDIRQKILPSNHPLLASSYNNIGMVYTYMGEYSKALVLHEKALEINDKTLSPNHPDFAQSYNNIASVYYNMKEYSKALLFFQRALNIFQSSLTANHPNIKTVQGNIDFLKQILLNNV